MFSHIIITKNDTANYDQLSTLYRLGVMLLECSDAGTTEEAKYSALVGAAGCFNLCMEFNSPKRSMYRKLRTKAINAAQLLSD